MTTPIRILVLSILIVVTAVAGGILPAHAQDSITLTITPPFFQLNLVPGQSWSSAIKVVNGNDRPLTLYGTAVNFAPEGEQGHGTLVPLINESAGADTFAAWTHVSAEAVTIGPEKTGEISFTLHVPDDASPGGHYGAILISTKPVEDAGASHVSVAGAVSSLFLLRIGGDIHEEGSLREFSTDSSVYQSPEATFVLRFENTGNVHLQPQGDVTIYNMWGRERGKILINSNTDFGNVLPKSVRKFSFTWKGGDTIFDAGRYTAIATLAYGKEARNNVSQSVSFWVVPIVPTLVTLGSLTFLITLIIILARAYVRRALGVELARLGLEQQEVPPETVQVPQRSKWSYITLLFSRLAMRRAFIEPIREEVIDLRKAANALPARGTPLRTPAMRLFIRKYVIVLIAIPFALIAIVWTIIYLRHVSVGQQNYDVQVRHDDQRSLQKP